MERKEKFKKWHGGLSSLSLIMVTTLCFLGCRKGNFQEVDNSTNNYPTTPVDSGRNGNGAGYKPAFEGQTRAPGAITQTPIVEKEIFRSAKLVHPWAIKQVDKDLFIISTRQGEMRFFGLDSTLSDPIAGVPSVFYNAISGSNAGLFDIALDPGFLNNKIIYFSYSKGTIDGNRLAVSKAKLNISSRSLENVVEIYESTDPKEGTNVYGGRLVFDPQGYLFVTVGDRNRTDSHYLAQNMDSSLGKILRIDKNGKPAPGNPYIGKTGYLPEIWVAGIRSPLGLAYHPVTGELYETEHGPRGGDELNIIKPGINYGWPLISYGLEYGSNNKVAQNRGIEEISGSFPVKYTYNKAHDNVSNLISQKEGLEQPRYYWDPVIAPGGICFYRSNEIKEWKNNLFVCGLASQKLTRLILKDGKVIGEENFLKGRGARMRDVAMGLDGALYVITDTEEGRIYKISKK
ncbi:Glucose/arabinose dehydrogenase, beta-propeller fold [bacterium A37T11]|nr:Glucose/arabinose dehydrogenase, beta-propeller fold [bacterium A37T11]